MHQKKEFSESATLTDMMVYCNDLVATGYIVHIEYIAKKIVVYGNKTTMEIEKLKEQYAILAAHPPAPQGKKWGDYQALMQGLERQLIEAGVQL